MSNLRQELGMDLARLKPTENLSKALSSKAFDGCVIQPKLDGCFEESTLILMSDGSSKKIRDVKKGDWVSSFDQSRKRLTHAIVDDVFDNGIGGNWVQLSVETDDGMVSITCTEDHPFYCNGSWLPAKDMVNKSVLVDPPFDRSSHEFRLKQKMIVEKKMRLKYPLLFDESFLVKSYVHEGLSTADIALKIGSSQQAVRTALDRIKVGLRTVKESHNTPIRRGKFSGSHNVNWQGGRLMWRGADWSEQRNLALARSGGVCEECGTSKDLHVHHIVPFRVCKSNDLSNLRVLCSTHHKEIENKISSRMPHIVKKGIEEGLRLTQLSFRKKFFDVGDLCRDYVSMLGNGKHDVVSELARKYGTTTTSVRYWLKKHKLLRKFVKCTQTEGRVVSVAPLATSYRRWNLSIRKTECYFAGTVLVHNCRYSLQLGGDGSPWLVSRSKEGKTKGVAFSKTAPYVVRDPEPWMHDLNNKWKAHNEGLVVIFDGELEAEGVSTSSEVTRIDTAKKYTAFDILYISDCGGPCTQHPYSDRLELLEQYSPRYDGSFSIIPSERVTEMTMDSLNHLLAAIGSARRAGTVIEGYVLKPLDWKYDKNWYGYKIKLEETQDGFINCCYEEKKHELGVVTKSGRCGTVGVFQTRRVGGRLDVHTMVTIVPLPLEDRCDLAEANAKFLGRVVEFSHLGWNGKTFAFPQFIRWREDKSANECTMTVKASGEPPATDCTDSD